MKFAGLTCIPASELPLDGAAERVGFRLRKGLPRKQCVESFFEVSPLGSLRPGFETQRGLSRFKVPGIIRLV